MYSFNARGITSWNLADANYGVFLPFDVPPGDNPVAGEKNSGDGRRCVIVLACHDDSKGLLSILVLNKKRERKFFVAPLLSWGEKTKSKTG